MTRTYGIIGIILGVGIFIWFWINKTQRISPEPVTHCVVAVSADTPPFSFIDTALSESPQGFEIDLIEAISQHMGLKFQIKNMDFSAILPAVQSGVADFGIAMLEITPDRAKNVSFSKPYYHTALVLVNMSGKPFTDPMAWKGACIGIQLGTAHQSYADKILKPKFPDFKIITYNRIGEMVQDLKNERLDGILLDESVAQPLCAQKGFFLQPLEMQSRSHYAIILAKGSFWEKPLNQALQDLKALQYIESLVQKWLVNTSR